MDLKTFIRQLYLFLFNPMAVCQNCKYGNNEEGKWLKHFGRNDNPAKGGHWYIWCDRVLHHKFQPWDRKKLCFKGDIK